MTAERETEVVLTQKKVQNFAAQKTKERSCTDYPAGG